MIPFHKRVWKLGHYSHTARESSAGELCGLRFLVNGSIGCRGPEALCEVSEEALGLVLSVPGHVILGKSCHFSNFHGSVIRALDDEGCVGLK